MKTKFQLIIWLFMAVPVINAQQTSRFPIKPSSVWRINYEYSCIDVTFNRENGDEEYSYFIDGDTIVGARTYFKLFKTGILYLESPFPIEHKYMGAIRDSADRFFYIAENEDAESQIYDFSVKVGDSIWVEEYNSRMPIDEIDTLENGRKKFVLYLVSVNCGSANTIIEGIGWLGGILEGNSCSGHPGVRGSYLLCYSVENNVEYETDHTRCGDEVPCNLIISGSRNRTTQQNLKVIILSDGKLRVSLPETSSGLYEIRIFDVLGKQKIHKTIELSEAIDVNSLEKGVYVIRINNREETASSGFVLR